MHVSQRLNMAIDVINTSVVLLNNARIVVLLNLCLAQRRNFAHLNLCFAARPATSRGQKLLITGQFDFFSSNLMHVSQSLKMANDLISFFRVDLYVIIYAHLRTRRQTLLKIVQFESFFFKFNARFTKTNSYDFRQLEVLSR